MIEQRLTSRMISYWNMVRKDRFYPDIQYLNSAVIEDLWPNCMQVALSQGTAEPSYKFEYMGKAIIEAYGRDYTGTQIDKNNKQFPGSIMYRSLEEVSIRSAPHETNGHLVNSAGKLMKYRACFLPFGTADKQITHIIGGLSFRVF